MNINIFKKHLHEHKTMQILKVSVILQIHYYSCSEYTVRNHILLKNALFTGSQLTLLLLLFIK